MTPNSVIHNERDQVVEPEHVDDNLKPRKYQIDVGKAPVFVYFHVVALYGVYLAFTSAKFLTIVQTFLFALLGNLGTTCGAHRLWSHNSYKVNTPLKIILVIMQTLSFQYSAIHWARDHRVHHKFTDTDADPHNSRRGFFFSHIGWMVTKRHPDFVKVIKSVDISDLTSDPILKFQNDYYVHLMALVIVFIPTAIPVYFWDELLINAWCLNVLRFVITLNTIALINSAAHIFGSKPYDRFICANENLSVAILACGEGWHNYHHTFPWDYKTSELGMYSTNFSTAFINFFAKIGWAYNLKTVSKDMVMKRVQRTGDGTHNVWGWKDKDVSKADIRDTTIIN